MDACWKNSVGLGARACGIRKNRVGSGIPSGSGARMRLLRAFAWGAGWPHTAGVGNERIDRLQRTESAGRPVGVTAGERRKHRRSNVEMTACVRRCKGNEELVVARNASRAGFEFLSSEPYGCGEAVEVAAPFLPGSTNIFVSARIVWQRANGGLYSHGVKYE